MRLIIFYLFGWLALLGWLWSVILQGLLPSWIAGQVLPFQCALIGALGGITYCLRAVYLNRCAWNRWDTNWHTWYYLRPIVSMVAGITAFLFLKAGLLVLDVNTGEAASGYGFLAFSYVAGLNVDRFYERLEGIAMSAWGIKPSGIAKQTEKGDQ